MDVAGGGRNIARTFVDAHGLTKNGPLEAGGADFRSLSCRLTQTTQTKTKTSEVLMNQRYPESFGFFLKRTSTNSPGRAGKSSGMSIRTGRPHSGRAGSWR